MFTNTIEDIVKRHQHSGVVLPGGELVVGLLQVVSVGVGVCVGVSGVGGS